MTRNLIAAVFTAALAAAASAVSAQVVTENAVVGQTPPASKPVKPVKPPVAVPEIDVGAGGSAIALIVGALLLAAERSRRRST